MKVFSLPHRSKLFVGDLVSQHVSFDENFFQVTIGDQKHVWVGLYSLICTQ